MLKNILAKTLSILITFAMLLALLPGGFIIAHAESGKCGASLTWTLNNSVLTISGAGDMYDYSVASQNDGYITTAPWGKWISSVIIESGVTSIGKYAFRGCTGLTSATIGNGMTSIGWGAFYGCTGLTSVTIPDGVTRIGREAFYGCTGLTSVTIPDSVTSIGEHAFYDCSSLTSVTIGNGVTSIDGGAFYNTGYYNDASNWENGVLYIGKWLIKAKTDTTGSCFINNETVGIADSAFYERTELTSITIPDSVTSIGDSAFFRCTGLTSVTIPDGVTRIGSYAFEDCTGLTSIIIPDSVTSIRGSAFDNTAYYNDSSNWQNGVLYIGKWLIKAKSDISGAYSIKDGTVGIAVGAFSGCAGLADIMIPDSVTSISGNALQRGDWLTSITVAPGNAVYHSAGNCIIETESKTLIIGCKNSVIPSDGSVTSIGEYAFDGCTGLTSVTIPDGVTSIGEGAFHGCTGLTSIIIPDGVTDISVYAFLNCTGLMSVTISDSVVSIGGNTFTGCKNMTAYVYRNTHGERYVKDYSIKYDYVLPSVITVSRLPDKLSYLEAKEMFNASGGKLTLNYESGYSTEIDMTDDMVSGFDNTVVGTQTLTATCDRAKVTFDVTIVAKSLSRIAVATLPSKLTYVETKAEGIDVTGGRLTLYYDNSTMDVIDMTADMVSGFDNTKVGVQTLTVTYSGKTTTFDVDIIAKSVSGIQVVTLPNKTSYLEGRDQLDITGGAVKVCYTNDSVRDAYMMYYNGRACLMFADDFSIVNLGISGFDNSVAGKCTVTVSYDGSAGTFEVDIIAKELTGIYVISAPNKTVYDTGEALDLSGGRLRLSYNNGTYQYANLISLAGNNLIIIDGESAAKEIIVSGFDSSWGGDKTVVISYGGFEVSLKVTVKGAVRGDPDGDGKITVGDALSALRVAARIVEATPELIATCDIDGDGKVTVGDALSILRVAARIVPSL